MLLGSLPSNGANAATPPVTNRHGGHGGVLPGSRTRPTHASPGSTLPWPPWRFVTGGVAAFAPFEGSEPNNMSGDQFTVVIRKSSRFLYDYGVGQLVSAVCECDPRAPVNADY